MPDEADMVLRAAVKYAGVGFDEDVDLFREREVGGLRRRVKA
jgi:hypothetical protein